MWGGGFLSEGFCPGSYCDYVRYANEIFTSQLIAWTFFRFKASRISSMITSIGVAIEMSSNPVRFPPSNMAIVRENDRS